MTAKMARLEGMWVHYFKERLLLERYISRVEFRGNSVVEVVGSFTEAVARPLHGRSKEGQLKFWQIFVPLILAKGKFLKTLASLAPPPH